MILLIDNYDSFSYNLYQLVGMIRPDIKVIRNDEMTIAEIEALAPDHIIVSPGPGRPKDAGICEEVIDYFKGKIPIFGVCLGHQAIGEVFGGKIVLARQVMHGKTDAITVTNEGVFTGIPQGTRVARYHSLVIDSQTLPACLAVTATSSDGEIMGIRHRELDIQGVQFHPESIATEHGMEMLKNFLHIRI